MHKENRSGAKIQSQLYKYFVWGGINRRSKALVTEDIKKQAVAAVNLKLIYLNLFKTSLMVSGFSCSSRASSSFCRIKIN